MPELFHGMRQRSYAFPRSPGRSWRFGSITTPLPGRSTSEEHHALITAEHARDHNATSIYHDIAERHGDTCSDQAVRRFVGTITSANPPYAKCRFETAPEAQIDYGEGEPTLDARASTASHACSACRWDTVAMHIGWSPISRR
jgi:hypothetical protein